MSEYKILGNFQHKLIFDATAVSTNERNKSTTDKNNEKV